MKNLIALTILLFLTGTAIAQNASELLPADQKEILGKWQGYYEQSGINKDLTIEFKEVNGLVLCFIDIPDRGIKNAKFEIGVCSAMDFHLERKSTDKTALSDNTYFMFVGKPKGNKMSGHYKVGESCKPGNLPSFSVTKL